MLKAILFDLDDTLIDWSGFQGPWDAFEIKHIRPVFDYIRRDVFPLSDFEGFLNEYLNRIRAAWEAARSTLVAPHLGRILVETAAFFGVVDGALNMERCLEEYRWEVVDGTALFPEVREVLSTLRKRGLKMGIVTNAHQPMSMNREIAQHGLLDFFPSCHCRLPTSATSSPIRTSSGALAAWAQPRGRFRRR
jgi:FMN phosphatase YigB (HAD superfamily)